MKCFEIFNNDAFVGLGVAFKPSDKFTIGKEFEIGKDCFLPLFYRELDVLMDDKDQILLFDLKYEQDQESFKAAKETYNPYRNGKVFIFRCDEYTVRMHLKNQNNT